ncbi:MAG: hypothetical protein EAZ42_13400 [Verrucomicrobia bacterium]|nr:MAG: hypothetical protein EAZ42_13400 [Verrucomicrobiota bacterium]
MFWMNGAFRPVDTGELFTFVRYLPEPVPTAMVVWASPTSALSRSGSEWSVVLKGHLLALLAQIYEHHEVIIQEDTGDGELAIPLKQRIRNLKDRCTSISRLIGFTEVSPLSVWTSEIEGVEEGVDFFELATNSCFNQVMHLPHIRKLLQNAEQRMRELQRDANRHEASFNRFAKSVK